MKIWVDDIRPAPDGYVWIKSVNEAKDLINRLEETKDSALKNNERKLYMNFYCNPIIVDIDHDAGEYASDGGDYIKLLDWLEGKGNNLPILIHIHSMNTVGVANMRRIIQRNGWKEV